MFIGSNEQFEIAATQERVLKMLAGVDAGNGTPAAAVVNTVLEVDRRIGGRNRPASQLSNVQFINLAFDIVASIGEERSSVELPYGTLLETGRLGEIRIGGETWVLDAGRPGLHPIETTRRDAHGPNLELLHRHIRRLTRGLACRRLGVPQAKHVCDNDDRNFLLFAPLDEAGGVVLQRWANGTDAPLFCAALPEQIKALAAEIVDDMREFWRRRKDVARQASEVRAVATHRIARSKAKIEAILLDMSIQRKDADLDFYVHYRGIDVAMRPGTVLDYIPAHRRAHMMTLGSPSGTNDRYEDLAVLKEMGADGRVSGRAAAILASGIVDRQAVLAKLSVSYDCRLALHSDSSPTYATFFWEEGTINAEVSMPGRLHWSHDGLDLLGTQVPEVTRMTMTGRPLSDLADLPFGGQLLIERAEELPNGVRLQLEEQNLLINLGSGVIWEELDQHS